ncbi:MAG TPA: hypothetical protein VIF62_16735 [Labilithrix sp.]
MSMVDGPIDPATGLPCSICSDGNFIRLDATGRDEMRAELAGWKDVCGAPLDREAMLARAAAIPMLRSAGVLGEESGAMLERLLAAYDARESTEVALPEDAYDALALRLRVRVDAAAAVGEIANFTNELAERGGVEDAHAYVFAAWAASAMRAGEALWSAAKRADELPIGASLDAEHRAVAAEPLGISGMSESALDVAGDVEFAVELATGAARVTAALARIAADAEAWLARGAKLHDEADAPARAFFAALGPASSAASADQAALLDAARRAPFGTAPWADARRIAIDHGARVRASVRAMRYALYRLVLTGAPAPAPPARIGEILAALRAAVYDASYRVGNVPALDDARRAIG